MDRASIASAYDALAGRWTDAAFDPDNGLRLHAQYHADVCAWRPPHAYHFISAWGSIWHVRLGQQHALMLALMRALEPGGVFLFSCCSRDGGLPGRRDRDVLRKWTAPPDVLRKSENKEGGRHRLLDGELQHSGHIRAGGAALSEAGGMLRP